MEPQLYDCGWGRIFHNGWPCRLDSFGQGLHPGLLQRGLCRHICFLRRSQIVQTAHQLVMFRFSVTFIVLRERPRLLLYFPLTSLQANIGLREILSFPFSLLALGLLALQDGIYMAVTRLCFLGRWPTFFHGGFAGVLVRVLNHLRRLIPSPRLVFRDRPTLFGAALGRRQALLHCGGRLCFCITVIITVSISAMFGLICV